MKKKLSQNQEISHEAVRSLLQEWCDVPGISDLKVKDIADLLDDRRFNAFLELLQKTALLLITPYLAESHDSKVSRQSGPNESERNEFIDKYKIRERDLRIIQAVLDGIHLKDFSRVIHISESWGNKSIRGLWNSLGLKNRYQLCFVAGWMRLLNPGFPCLDILESQETDNRVTKKDNVGL